VNPVLHVLDIVVLLNHLFEYFDFNEYCYFNLKKRSFKGSFFFKKHG